MITLDHVSKKYKASARPALDDINVKIDKGEFVFLIGPSGSGKSTFMRLLLAEETPNTGELSAWWRRLGVTEDGIIRVFRGFNANAAPFRNESEAHEHA